MSSSISRGPKPPAIMTQSGVSQSAHAAAHALVAVYVPVLADGTAAEDTFGVVAKGQTLKQTETHAEP